MDSTSAAEEEGQLVVFLGDGDQINSGMRSWLDAILAFLPNSLFSIICKFLPGATPSQSANVPNYYEVLGIGRNASQDAIKKARDHLARQHHPDRQSANGDGQADDSQFKMISEAYRVLSDPVLRNWYDGAGPQGLQIHKNWNEAKDRAAEYSTKPIRYAPLRQVMGTFGMEREYEEMQLAIQAGQGIPEPLASSMRECALGHIVRAVQAALGSNFECAKCKKGINGLEGLCYCQETSTFGPHCRNEHCCPNCKRGRLSKIIMPVSNFFNVVGEFLLKH